MRKLGLLLASMLTLGAFMGLNAGSAAALVDEGCKEGSGGVYYVYGLRITTENAFGGDLRAEPRGFPRAQDRAVVGRGGTCGAETFNAPAGTSSQQLIDDFGGNTLNDTAEIIEPPGADTNRWRSMCPGVNGRLIGRSTIRLMSWADVKGVGVVAINRTADGTSIRVDCGPQQPPPLGCPAAAYACGEARSPLGFAKVWWEKRDIDPDPKVTDERTVFTVGRFTAVTQRPAGLTTFVRFGNCATLGGTAADAVCGGAADPVVGWNGTPSVDEYCSDGLGGTWFVTATTKGGVTYGSDVDVPAATCMAWADPS